MDLGHRRKCVLLTGASKGAERAAENVEIQPYPQVVYGIAF